MDIEILVNKVSWMYDILPEDHKYFTFLKKVYRHEFRKNGYRRISTTLVEKTSLYEKVFDSNTALNTLFSFQNKGGENVSLRPEASIGIMRAYLESSLAEELQPVYLYHIDRYFRKDSLWLADYNQFYLIGGEIIGERDPILDALQIFINYKVFNQIGLSWDFEITINSLWNNKEQDKYIEELKNFYENKKHLLTENWKKLLAENVIALLASTDEDEVILAKQAPAFSKFLKKDSKEYYSKLKQYLDILAVPYREDHTLIHYFSYYTDSIWKITHTSTNEWIVMGGRYDSLSKKMWYVDEVPATWFYVRSDKLVQLLKEKDIKIRNKDAIDLYFVQLWDEPKQVVLPLSLLAREKWINTLTSLGTPSMKEQMLKAQRIGAKFVVIVWIMEARNGKFQVRNMQAGTQEEVMKDKLIEYIIEKIWNDRLDFYEPSRDLLI